MTLLALLACTGPDDASTLPANAPDAVATYADIVHATYEDSGYGAAELRGAITSFTATPDAAGLDAARTAWLDNRESYLQSEAFRFYDGPIDNPTDGPEGLINAWPMDEAYVDYVEGDETAGIINDPTVPIDADTLMGLNESGGEKNIATGYHAIEFLLWGQDFDDAGPGARPYQDYLIDGDTAAPNAERRAQYLFVIAELLEGHLRGLDDAWEDTAGSYREGFTADGNEFTALQNALTGIIVLSGFETGGERLQAALDSGEQEDEHSCFSDNTHRDMVVDVVGIGNVWWGEYGGEVDGTGLRDVVAEVDADLAASVDDRIDESLALAEALQPPFDQEINPANDEGNARVQALIDSLRTQEELLFEVFSALGMTVEIPE